MRTRNSFLNFLANEGSHVLNLILSFIARTVFIYALSQAYLGVNGLFGNILSVLSLAELGIGTAMVYHIYKPISEGNIAEQQALMNMYRRMYELVALVITVAGLILVPFLKYLVKDTYGIDWTTLRIIYLMYLFNTVSSYFFSYKRALIDAYQKQYINTIINTIFTTIQFVVQIIVLLAFRNFIAYLLVQIVCNVMTQMVGARKADRMFPFLRQDRKTLPDKALRTDIYKNVGAMFMHRLGDVVVNNTDNLIMSAFVGLAEVGIYSNYLMIQTSINTALNGVFGAFQASIGDLGAEKNRQRLYEVYQTLLFLGFWLYGFCTVAFLVLYNPFIEFWIDLTGRKGSDYLFPMSVVLIIVINFYIAGMRKVTLTFRDALGLYWYDRYKPIFEVTINIVASLILVVDYGVVGIFVGTLISTMSTCFWIEPLITYKHGFHQPVRKYFGMFAIYTVAVLIDGALTYRLAAFWQMGGLMEVLLKALTVLVVYNAVVWIAFHKTRMSRELWGALGKVMKNRKENKGKVQ